MKDAQITTSDAPIGIYSSHQQLALAERKT